MSLSQTSLFPFRLIEELPVVSIYWCSYCCRQGEWAVKAPAKRKYTQVFNAADRSRTGFLTGVQARGILVQSKLPQATLARIWTMADMDCDGRLSCDEFILAMFLCDKAMNGEKIPAVLPLDWIPPSYRKSKSRQGSIVAGGATSRPGSQAASRHASISSQGALEMDPAAGLPQSKRNSISLSEFISLSFSLILWMDFFL